MGICINRYKVMEMLKKYRYPILILLIGFALMAIPANVHKNKENIQQKVEYDIEDGLELRLSNALSQMWK